MAITAQELNIILSARDKQFTQAMERNQRRVERFTAKTTKDLGRTTKAFNSMGRATVPLHQSLRVWFLCRRLDHLLTSQSKLVACHRLPMQAQQNFRNLRKLRAPWG